MVFDVCIVGGGPAGIYAGYCCGTSNISFCIIETLSALGGQCFALYGHKEIYGVPGFVGITASNFIDQLVLQASPFLNSVYLDSLVNNISRNNDSFSISFTNKKTSNTSVVECKYLVLATGIGDMKPNLPNNIAGIDDLLSSNLIHFYNCNFEQYCGLDVVVAGGGDSAADFAIDCSRYAKHVYIIHRRDRMTCQDDKKEIILNTGNISVILNHQLESIKRISDDEVAIVTDQTSLAGNRCVICYGFTSSTHLVDKLEILGCNIDSMRVLVSLDNMQTSINNCYAIGDIATYTAKKRNVTNCFYEGARAIRDIKQKINQA